jgi:ubiquinone/menaquinone biosynthesis C-methylase UbiE
MKEDMRNQDEIKAGEFNEIAKNIFAPVYPILAEIVLGKIDTRQGICLDLGSGPGHFAIAMARMSDFLNVSLDFSEHAQRFASENIKDAGVGNRVKPIRGDVHKLPFRDSSVDLVISRGSIFFWDSPVEVFNEVHRILKPGCTSFIGGGFGTPELKRKIVKTMEEKTGDFKASSGKRMSPENIERLSNALSSSSAVNYKVERDDANLWFIIQK